MKTVVKIKIIYSLNQMFPDVLSKKIKQINNKNTVFRTKIINFLKILIILLLGLLEYLKKKFFKNLKNTKFN